jgi:hypothetical protein
MKLEVLNVALEAIELLKPIVVRIKRHDRNLARQVTDAATSSVLNTGEGALSDAGTRRSRYSPQPVVPTRYGSACSLPFAGATSLRRPPR